ncbi:hypothetical protein GCM10022270_10930 [Terriglobus aquaticus]
MRAPPTVTDPSVTESAGTIAGGSTGLAAAGSVVVTVVIFCGAACCANAVPTPNTPAHDNTATIANRIQTDLNSGEYANHRTHAAAASPARNGALRLAAIGPLRDSAKHELSATLRLSRLQEPPPCARIAPLP